MKKFLLAFTLLISLYGIGQRSSATKYTGNVHPRVIATLNLVENDLEASQITIKHVDGIFVYDAKRSTDDLLVFVKTVNGKIIPYTYFELQYNKAKGSKDAIKSFLRDRGTKLRFRFEK